MKRLILNLVFVLLISINNVFSQQVIMVIDSTNDGIIRLAQVSGGIKPLTTKDTKDFLKHTLKSEVGVDFYLHKTITDDLGMTHEKYH